MRDGKRWQRLVERELADFFGEFDFRVAKIDVETWWWVAATYSNPVSALRFVRDFEVDGCTVDLGRPVDGHLPPHPIWISEGPINWVPLKAVLEVRSPELLEQAHQLRGLEKDELARQLRFWVEAIRSSAPEFLHGDSTCIDEAAAVLRRQMQPETLTISLPDDASEDEMRRAIEEAQATVPPEITVIGQRYSRRN